MTGWRLGWLVVPATLTDALGKLIEFNTSCASVFTQRAALAALAHRDADHARDRRAPEDLPRHAGAAARRDPRRAGGGAARRHVRVLRLDGFDDSLDVARRLVTEAGLGLAPGAAFAPEAGGLAALVLRGQGHRAARRRRAAAARVAGRGAARASGRGALEQRAVAGGINPSVARSTGPSVPGRRGASAARSRRNGSPSRGRPRRSS